MPRWDNSPQFYRVDAFPMILSRELQWAVVMNGHKIVERCRTLADAQRLAASRNYAENCYPCPRMFGMDGVD